jgi:hypothetical protein
VEPRGEGFLMRIQAEVEIEHGDRPALVADLLYMAF